MFKKKITYKDVCTSIITLSGELSPEIIKILEPQLTNIDKRFKIVDYDKAELDVMLSVIFLELTVAKNTFDENTSERLRLEMYALFQETEGGLYCIDELKKYQLMYDDALSRGGNPISGVGSHLLYRLSGDDRKVFTDDNGKFNMFADLTVMNVLVQSTSIVKITSEKYKLI